MGSELTPDMMVPLKLQSERLWTLIESFVTLVIKTREHDGRRERNNGEGQQKSHLVLRPRSCVSGGLGCLRRSGEESVVFLPWVARLVGLPSGRVAAGGGSEGTDDERVVRDFNGANHS